MSENNLPPDGPPAPVAPSPAQGALITTRLNASVPEVDRFDDGAVRMIGEVLESTGDLSRDQVRQILEHQATSGTKFGESAVALGFVAPDVVLMGLGRQLHRPPSSSLDDASIPSELVVLRQPFSEAAEILRDVRSRLVSSVLSTDRKPRKALAVCSVDLADGKTWFATNLAVSLAQLGARVLLIDADLRGPRSHRVFGLDGTIGLSELLAGKARLTVGCPLQEMPRLFLLQAGSVPLNPLELLQGPAFGLLIQQMLREFDYVLVDTPAGLHGADSRVTAAAAGAALVVVRKNRARAKDLNQFVSLVTGAGAEFAGIVLNAP